MHSAVSRPNWYLHQYTILGEVIYVILQSSTYYAWAQGGAGKHLRLKVQIISLSSYKLGEHGNHTVQWGGINVIL